MALQMGFLMLCDKEVLNKKGVKLKEITKFLEHFSMLVILFNMRSLVIDKN